MIYSSEPGKLLKTYRAQQGQHSQHQAAEAEGAKGGAQCGAEGAVDAAPLETGVSIDWSKVPLGDGACDSTGLG